MTDYNKTALKQAALIVVDPQHDLLSREGAGWDLFGDQVAKRSVVTHLRTLRDAAEAAGLPVLYSSIEIPEAAYAEWNPVNGLQRLMGERNLLEKGKGTRFVPELEPNPGTILLEPRTGPSSLDSDVFDHLERLGVDTVIVAGMVANLCVEGQVRDALAKGLRVVVAKDAVATVSDEAHEATLGNFELLASKVATTDEIVAELR